jgi:hypothetical protein
VIGQRGQNDASLPTDLVARIRGVHAEPQGRVTGPKILAACLKWPSSVWERMILVRLD